MLQQESRQSSSSLDRSAARSALQQPSVISRTADTEAQAAAVIVLAPKAVLESDDDSRDEAVSSSMELPSPLSSSLLSEAVVTKSVFGSDAEVQGCNSAAAEVHQPSSSMPAESAYGFSGLDAFLHTVTSTDEVLNDLLGDLSCSASSSVPSELSRQSSSAMLDLAQADRSGNNDFASVSMADAMSSSSLLPSTEVRCTSSSPPAAEAIYSSSAQPAQSPGSPRGTTDMVLDALLEKLHSAELARQSSSAALLDSLTSLAGMHRQSSSSPVAGACSPDQFQRQPSSSFVAAISSPEFQRQLSFSPGFGASTSAETEQQLTSSPRAPESRSADTRLQSSSLAMAGMETACSSGIKTESWHGHASSYLPAVIRHPSYGSQQRNAAELRRSSSSAAHAASVSQAEAAVDVVFEDAEEQSQEEDVYDLPALGGGEEEEDKEEERGLQRVTTHDLVMYGLLDGVNAAESSSIATFQVCATLNESSHLHACMLALSCDHGSHCNRNSFHTQSMSHLLTLAHRLSSQLQTRHSHGANDQHISSTRMSSFMTWL